MAQNDLFDSAKPLRDKGMETLDALSQGRRDSQYYGERLTAHLGAVLLEHVRERSDAKELPVELAHAAAGLIQNIARIARPKHVGHGMVAAINRWQLAIAEMLRFRVKAERDGFYETVFGDDSEIPDFRDQLKGRG